MGNQIIGALSVSQLQKLIRRIAKDSANVFISPHASERMSLRKISQHEVLEVLRHGTMPKPAEPNNKYGTLECSVEHYIAGRTCRVVAALEDEKESTVVVTVINLRKRG